MAAGRSHDDRSSTVAPAASGGSRSVVSRRSGAGDVEDARVRAVGPDEQGAQGRHLGGRHGNPLLEAHVHRHHHRSAVGELPGEEVPAEGGVDRDGHRPEPGSREPQRHPLGGGPHEQRHPVPLPHPQVTEGGGRAQGPLLELAVGEGLVVDDEQCLVGALGGLGVEHGRDREALAGEPSPLRLCRPVPHHPPGPPPTPCAGGPQPSAGDPSPKESAG